MIVLRANQELKLTFDKLIETMKVPVKWNGIFAVVDNYIILQGEVRSLFFHFDSKKVVTNIIDIPIVEEDVEETGQCVQVRNVINMILYVFGKWGTINGLKVEKNYAQLNQLFSQILSELQVEPEYNQDYFRFYRNGIRVTYEDVIQYALEYREETVEETLEETEGLWHKLVWKKEQLEFSRVETTLEERQRSRIGSNFYMVGYLCPICGEKLHMVVYPVDREFRIETEEGGVLLARAATCEHCNCFYTPRPERLFSEGDVYTMHFADDKKAYEDYLELMGKRGERVSNHRFNQYVNQQQQQMTSEEADRELEEFYDQESTHSEEEIRKIQGQMEEGYYPDESIRRLEYKIKKQSQPKGAEEIEQEESGKTDKLTKPERQTSGQEVVKEEGISKSDQGRGQSMEKPVDVKREEVKTEPNRTMEEEEAYQKEQQAYRKEQQQLREKYEAKLRVCDRFSDRQLREFKEQLIKDTRLAQKERDTYITEIEKRILAGKKEQIAKKMEACKGKTFVLIKRVYEDVEREELPQEEKLPFLTTLKDWMHQQGEIEVRQLMEKIPPNMDRARYRQFAEKLQSYEGIDLSPYQEILQSRRELAEKKELEDVVKRARKNTKEDLRDLSKRLEEGDFLPELILPYCKKIDEKIREIDADEIAKICVNPMEMSFADGLEAYHKIEEGDFLPELKADALRMLSKRLSKIKTDECELLVKKLQEEMNKAGVELNSQHYFYPARRVLLEQASPKETEVIDFAVASYAAGKGLFEYPVMVVDTSRNSTGKEGIILTPDHFYFSTMFSAYGIPVSSIDKVTASTGLLNKGVYVYQKNGNKTKVPYGVDTKNLSAYAGVLNEFIHYLQDKPDSRSVDYLVKEKHDTICCFRCGYVYKGGSECPKCGYKNNE